MATNQETVRGRITGHSSPATASSSVVSYEKQQHFVQEDTTGATTVARASNSNSKVATLASDSESMKNLDRLRSLQDHQKEEKRLEKNRIKARNARKRKKNMIEDLQQRMKDVEEENQLLKNENGVLKRRLMEAELRDQEYEHMMTATTAEQQLQLSRGRLMFGAGHASTGVVNSDPSFQQRYLENDDLNLEKIRQRSRQLHFHATGAGSLEAGNHLMGRIAFPYDAAILPPSHRGIDLPARRDIFPSIGLRTNDHHHEVLSAAPVPPFQNLRSVNLKPSQLVTKLSDDAAAAGHVGLFVDGTSVARRVRGDGGSDMSRTTK